WVNKALAKAQQKVEARNYDIRKQLLKYDDVMNDQRKVVYEQRRDIMSAREVAATIADMRNDTIESMVAAAIPENALPEQWDTAGLHAECLRLLALDLPLAEWAKEEGIDAETVEDRLVAAADRKMAERTANYGSDLMRTAEKSLLLQLLDQSWKDHLLSLDHLRQGINLRAYAQRDPLNEYKREAFELFEGMLVNLREQLTSVLSHVELRVAPPEPEPPPFAAWSYGEPAPAEREEVMAEAAPPLGRAAEDRPRSRARRRGNGNGGNGGNGRDRSADQPAEQGMTPRAPWAGTPRNATCPCGSGKKFKHCHGRV
ncbi:MAG TPA: SEC-C metal-binding domain-containing protein, partial [Stellaceae bacterium]|nr:SEC-C metal-binding domain-containing protein [Stellaceae bacterium]